MNDLLDINFNPPSQNGGAAASLGAMGGLGKILLTSFTQNC